MVDGKLCTTAQLLATDGSRGVGDSLCEQRGATWSELGGWGLDPWGRWSLFYREREEKWRWKRGNGRRRPSNVIDGTGSMEREWGEEERRRHGSF